MSSDTKIHVGVVGLGAAGRAFLPSIQRHKDLELVAVADAAAEVSAAVAAEEGVSGYRDLSSLLEHPRLDAICVATPTQLHSEHAIAACQAGKHVLTEKPMATDLDHARTMVEAAERAGVVMLVGHSHGYDLPIQRMRQIITSERLGRVRMIHTWCFTDWMYRPRREDELDIRGGGGVIYRQGAHQVDIIRYLGGGLARSVRAQTFDWDPSRRSIGAHTIFLSFVDGTTATAVYNGYGHFSSTELVADITELGFLQTWQDRPLVNRTSAISDADVLEAKRKRAKNAIPAQAPYQPHFGITLVSCERGDMRQSPAGLYLYSDGDRKEIVLPTDQNPRDLVMSEFADAIKGRATAVHSGRWGLANLEVCEVAVASSHGCREINLKHQVPVAR